MPRLANIGQLATCPPGGNQADVGLIDDAALVWQGDEITWVGAAADLPPPYAEEDAFDCGGRLVIPGLVDFHTHLCFGGWRGDEFAMRLEGRSYLEIAEAGGGIKSTVRATREASFDSLKTKAGNALAATAAAPDFRSDRREYPTFGFAILLSSLSK